MVLHHTHKMRTVFRSADLIKMKPVMVKIEQNLAKPKMTGVSRKQVYHFKNMYPMITIL